MCNCAGKRRGRFLMLQWGLYRINNQLVEGVNKVSLIMLVDSIHESRISLVTNILTVENKMDVLKSSDFELSIDDYRIAAS